MNDMENKEMTENKEVKEKPYTLRPLCDEDLYPVLGIIAKVLPEDLSQVFVEIVTKEKSVQEVGYDVGFKLVTAVIKNLPKIGDDVYDFLSGISDIPADKIRKMPFGTTPKMIWDIYNDIKNADFFGDASKSS